MLEEPDSLPPYRDHLKKTMPGVLNINFISGKRLRRQEKVLSIMPLESLGYGINARKSFLLYDFDPSHRFSDGYLQNACFLLLVK